MVGCSPKGPSGTSLRLGIEIKKGVKSREKLQLSKSSKEKMGKGQERGWYWSEGSGGKG